MHYTGDVVGMRLMALWILHAIHYCLTILATEVLCKAHSQQYQDIPPEHLPRNSRDLTQSWLE